MKYTIENFKAMLSKSDEEIIKFLSYIEEDQYEAWVQTIGDDSLKDRIGLLYKEAKTRVWDGCEDFLRDLSEADSKEDKEKVFKSLESGEYEYFIK